MQRVIEQHSPEYVEAPVVKLSILVACACVLQVAESLLPHPLPGVRLGLANIITLIVLVDTGFKDAMKVALLRVLIGSLILGTFLTPAFVLSLSGSVMSTFLMGLCYKLSTSTLKIRLSLVGISIVGSLSHNLVQLAVVYLLFIRSAGVLLLWPWLALSGVVMGVITGVVGIQVCRALESAIGRNTNQKLLINVAKPVGRFVSKGSWIHTLRPEMKILFIIGLAVALIFFKGYLFYTGVLVFLIFLTVLSQVELTALLYSVKKISSFVILSFMMPVIFTSFGRVLLVVGPIRVTDQGMLSGSTYAFRIVLLFFASSLLALTTTPSKMARGFERFLMPARVFGISSVKLAQSLCVSWSFFPVLWQHAYESLRRFRARKKIFTAVIHFLGDFVVGLYVHADSVILSSDLVVTDVEIENSGIMEEGLSAT